MAKLLSRGADLPKVACVGLIPICPLTVALESDYCVKGILCMHKPIPSSVLHKAAPQPPGPYLGLSVGLGSGTP